ncbi:(2Fe-2S) ferredoxin domain-containing protein [Thermocoleostomius sinensis]|uniref:(2Fe-2S) ferredoxin domain-containing protein n=1 Tax=Thermocoleostomius sinensis A174 TaxID=2016057 RepID=A0A9E8Z957_9CYAN|nr:(2Fe-2S) ferredoxin domain-containing protein [Thermocoleostomius sinensis]WAL58813.1 (2Fe-2S) ferredoxin domain-containing protein [Thermocoleostomius sinensis A174]
MNNIIDPPVRRTVLVCQHQACRKAGARQVFALFQTSPLPDVAIVPVQCLGECGNGPMVLVLPERIWYNRVNPDEVPAIIQRHLQQGTPIEPMLYPKFHSH